MRIRDATHVLRCFSGATRIHTCANKILTNVHMHTSSSQFFARKEVHVILGLIEDDLPQLLHLLHVDHMSQKN